VQKPRIMLVSHVVLRVIEVEVVVILPSMESFMGVMPESASSASLDRDALKRVLAA